MKELTGHLTPAQIELLKVLARPTTEEDLLALKRLIVRYFAEMVIHSWTEIWDQNGWTTSDTQRLLQEHHRIPYNPS
jgi:hypothetical protein